MSAEPNPFEQIGRRIGVSPATAQATVCQFLEWLNSRLQNYEGLNGDFVGEKLHWLLSRRTFYHLLGLFEQISGRYTWEPGVASQYLLRIAPREEWPSLNDEEDAPLEPEAKELVEGMVRVASIATDDSFSIGLCAHKLSSRLYLRLRVSEENFMTGDGFTMIDYVPITQEDLADLAGLEAHEALLRVQEFSKGRDCIETGNGAARRASRVFYPHT